MSLRTNWAGLFAKKPNRNQRRVEAKHKPKLSLTQLEDRTVPTTFFVSTAGDDTFGLGTIASPYRSIQKALNVAEVDASSPHTIKVAAGTYSTLGFDNGFSIGNSATPAPNLANLDLEGGYNATFTTQTFGSTVYLPQTNINNSAPSALTPDVIVYENGVNIRGFDFVFDGQVGNGGTKVSGGLQSEATGVVFDHNTIEVGFSSGNPRSAGIVVHSPSGGSSAGVQVTNNTIVANAGATFAFANGSTGIFINPDTAGIRATPIIVSGNDISGPNLGVGIAIDRLSFVTVDSNSIQRTGAVAGSFPLIDLRQATAGTGAYGTSQSGIIISNNLLDGLDGSAAGSVGIDMSARGGAIQQVTGVTVSNNIIRDVAFGVVTTQATVQGSGVNATGNSFTGITNKAVSFGGTGTANFSGNWFGSSVYSTVNGLISGSVDFTPYLNLGTDTSAAPGFQGDYSDLTVHAGVQTGATGRIQEGVNSVTTGGIERVLAGTYNELVAVTKSVTIKGAQAGVDARTRAAVPESIVSNGDGDFQILANNVTIDGFTLSGVVNDPSSPPFTGLGAAVWTNPGFSGTNGGHQILNNIIQGNISGIELDNDGTFATKVQYNLIQNNNAPGAGSGNGIEVNFGLSNAVIDNNTFVNNPNGAISVFVGGPNVAITNNVSDGQIYAASVTGGSITGNKITNSSSGGIVLGGGDSGISITNNEVNGVAAGFGAFRLRDDGPGASSTLTVNHNIFAAGAGAYGVRPGAGSYSGTLTISESQISGGLAAIQNDDAALNINASTNYWGTSNPATVAATLLGAGSSLIDFTPLIDNGDTAPATVGFQSNLSSLTVHSSGPQTGATGRITEGYNTLAATGSINVINGTYAENVNLGAGANKAVTLAAGSNPGQVVINGNLTLTSNDTLPIQLGGTAAANYDSFAVNGTVALGNAALTLSLINGYTVPSGQFPTFTIINNDSTDLVGGTFFGKAEGSTITAGGSTFTITYKGGVNSNDVVLIRDIAPTNIALTPSSIQENNSIGAVIGNFSSTDADAGDSFTYTLVPGAGSTDNGSFTINGSGQLVAGISFNFEAKSSYSIRVRTTDFSGLTFEKILTVTIIDVNETPTDINLSNNTINWFFGPNATVGTLSTVDPDTFPQTFTYALVPGSGSANNALFNISGNTLRVTNSFALVPGTTYSVRISTNDGQFTIEKQFNIIAVDVYRAPPVVVLSRTTGTINTIEWQDKTGATLWTIPTPAGYGAGLVQAVSDRNGDGYADFFIGSNSGMPNRLGLIDGKTGVELWHTNPFVANFTGGVNLAVGDLDADGKPEVIVGAGPAGGPNVRAFQQNAGPGFTFSMIRDYYAYYSGFTGGVNVAVADVNRDGYGDIITGTGSGSNNVRVFSKGVGTSMFMDFYAFAPTFAGGVKVGAGDVNGDGYADIIAAKQTQASQVRVISGNGPYTSTPAGITNNAILMDFATSNQTLGVQLFARDFELDGKAEIVTHTTQDISVLVNVFEYTGTLAPTTLQAKTYFRLNQASAPVRIG